MAWSDQEETRIQMLETIVNNLSMEVLSFQSKSSSKTRLEYQQDDLEGLELRITDLEVQALILEEVF